MVVLSKEEAEERILELLKEHGELTTQEIEEHNNEEGMNCPDGVVKTLTRMKFKGIVKGKLSPEKGGWAWRIEE